MRLVENNGRSYLYLGNPFKKLCIFTVHRLYLNNSSFLLRHPNNDKTTRIDVAICVCSEEEYKELVSFFKKKGFKCILRPVLNQLNPVIQKVYYTPLTLNFKMYRQFYLILEEDQEADKFIDCIKELCRETEYKTLWKIHENSYIYVVA